MKTISLLHPFSAKSIGLKERDLYHSHSKSQELALNAVQNNYSDYKIRIDYFTEKCLPYSKRINSNTKRFFPVTKPLGKGRSVWRRQHSLWHYFEKPSDLTIINMSGHGSKYCFKYAKRLSNQGLPYLTMIGGIHMSTHKAALTYYKEAHHILVHTEKQRKDLLRLFEWKAPDIRVLPLGIDLSYFTFKDKGTDVKHLLFVGRITPLKRVELTFEALSACKNAGLNVHLDIIGFISNSDYYSQLLLKVEKQGLRDVITFHSPMKQEDLLSYYQRADMLLLPSEHESFGMVMVEAMACGCAIAAIEDTGGPDDIVENNYNGVLTNISNYPNAVLNLLKSPMKLMEVQSNAVKTAKSRYDVKITSEILCTSIQDALKKSHA